MADVNFFAWFTQNYRPVNRPSNVKHRFPMILAGTKVSIMEAVILNGEPWYRLIAPPDYLTDGDTGYVDDGLWVPGSVLTRTAPASVEQLPPASAVSDQQAADAMLVLLRYVRGR